MQSIKIVAVLLFCGLMLTACTPEKTTTNTIESQTYYTNSDELSTFTIKDIPAGKMRACFGQNYPKYTYILYAGKAYQKVEHIHGVTEEIVVTKKQICHNNHESDGWTCLDHNPGDYINIYYSIAKATEEPQKTMFKLECTNIDYDESVFLI